LQLQAISFKSQAIPTPPLAEFSELIINLFSHFIIQYSLPSFMKYSADIQKTKRHFLPENFALTDWAALEPWYVQLIERDIQSGKQLEQWLADLSELEAALSEDACWRQIRMTCDNENKALEEAFNYFCLEIQPKIDPCDDQLNKKLVNSPYLNELDPQKYLTFLRNTRKSLELFCEANIPLRASLSVMQQQYGIITGKMTITVEGREYTLPQAAKFLEHENRELREQVYRQMNERRLEDKAALNELYTKLVEQRTQMAKNAGFENYRDFKFKELGRFDYTKEDCFQFHEGVRLHIMPLANEILAEKKAKLGLDVLRPWDTEAEPPGIKPLNPFATGDELLEKSIQCFEQLHPFFAGCLRKMKELKHFDLESRKGKSPGGYNCPLAESGAPFIFMNAAGQMRDVTTMVHEGGHAVHSFLAHPLQLNAFKDYPMEIAEVASMSMELFTMDYWEVFFSNPEDLKRAKLQQLERLITIFPWIATIDKFQHWVYEHPVCTIEERDAAWVHISDEFSSPVLDISGLEVYRSGSWQRQLHLYEVPFYYIEYGIAQLGAIGMWMQYRANPQQALENYCNALSLGGTRTLPELYTAAGLEFDFSPARIKTLMDFVHAEMKQL
jgi:oligoendopeptidase F